MTYLLGDDAQRRLRLQRTFERDVAGRTPHQFDEMPVLLGAVCIAGDVADQLAVGLGRGIEAETRLDVLVLEIAVDRLGNTDHLDLIALLAEELGQQGGVGVAVVSTDHHDRRELVSQGGFACLGKLLLGLDLGASAADQVETAGVPVLRQQLGLDLERIVVHQTTGAAAKTDQATIGMNRLDRVEQSGDHVVSSRRLTAGQNNSYGQRFCLRGLAAAERCDRRTVGVRKQFPDTGLVRDRFGRIPPTSHRSPQPVC